jgi:membrane associated rhomboid family serine protease
MLQPPSLKDVPRYPVTASISALAIAVTVMWWRGHSIEGLAMNGRVWEKWELWRAFTSTLPHVGIFHLGFNLYWFWVFGTLVERIYGHVRMAAIVLLLAFVSMLAEFSLLSGGVGLSGVGYGLWAMLWVLEQRDARFAGAVDPQTSMTFVIWFFLCVVLTITNVMRVANIAHGIGAGMGFLLAHVITSKSFRRWQNIAAMAAVTIFFVAGSTVIWPQVNFSGDAELDVEHAALDALDRNDVPRAIKLLQTCTHMRHAPARASYNLGVAYLRANRFDDALAAYQHAASMPGSTSEYQQAAERMKNYKAAREALNHSGTGDKPPP